MRFPKTILAAVAGTVLTVVPSFAQDVKISPPVVSPRVTAAQTIMLSDMMRWDIVLQNGESVGQISDFVIGPQGDVLFAVGTLNGQSYVMPFGAMTVDAKSQMVQLAATPAQFDQLAFFEGRNFPDFSSPAFRQQMTQIYGDRIFNSGTSLRGRGNLGANQTDGRDILNPAGKAPPGLNRDRDDLNRDNNALNRDANDRTIGGKKETGDSPRGTGKTPADVNETKKRQGVSPRLNGKSPVDANRDRNNLDADKTDRPDIQKPVDRPPTGVNPLPPTPPSNPTLPNKPNVTPTPPTSPPLRPGTASGSIPPVKPTPPSSPPVPGSK